MEKSEHRTTREKMPVFDDHHGRPDVWPGLTVYGLVQNPAVLTESDLANLTQRSLTDDFRCLEGWSVPDQTWDGVPLSALLEIAGPLSGAGYAAISAADFSVTIPLDDAAGILLATRLNGSPLPPEHGGPCRLVAADQACYASVKWVDRIMVTSEPTEETARAIAAARNAARSATIP